MAMEVKEDTVEALKVVVAAVAKLNKATLRTKANILLSMEPNLTLNSSSSRMKLSHNILLANNNRLNK
jgi:hypothetical protein